MGNNKQVRNITADYVRLYHADQESHRKTPVLLHKHMDFTEITYVIEGKIIYRIGSRMYELNAGDAVIVDAGVWHGEEPFMKETSNTVTCAINHIMIDGEQTDALVKGNKPALVRFEPGGIMENLMLVLMDSCFGEDRNDVLCEIVSGAILNLTYNSYLEQSSRYTKTEKKADELVRTVCTFLDENYTMDISLEELGKRFGVSQYYLSHIFKKETGVAPMKYVMHRKLGEAQNLLMNTDLPIGKIVEELGFSSNCHLSSVFKKYFGESPKEFRTWFKTDRDKEKINKGNANEN